jgi:hypothetical protein
MALAYDVKRVTRDVDARFVPHGIELEEARRVGINGRRLTLTNDEAYELIMAVAEGKLDCVDDIAAAASQPRQ